MVVVNSYRLSGNSVENNFTSYSTLIMKQLTFKLTLIFLIICLNVFAQNSIWKNKDQSISINYNQNWVSIVPDDNSVVKFKPSVEFSNNKLTSIALTVTRIDEKINTLEDMKEFMRKYITNIKTGKLISFENKNEGKREILVTTMSRIGGSTTYIYKSYIFIFKKKFYNLMLLSREVDFEQNEIALKEMYESLRVK